LIKKNPPGNKRNGSVRLQETNNFFLGLTIHSQLYF
jgi:hypothetical protein